MRVCVLCVKMYVCVRMCLCFACLCACLFEYGGVDVGIDVYSTSYHHPLCKGGLA